MVMRLHLVGVPCSFSCAIPIYSRGDQFFLKALFKVKNTSLQNESAFLIPLWHLLITRTRQQPFVQNPTLLGVWVIPHMTATGVMTAYTVTFPLEFIFIARMADANQIRS